MSRFNIDGPLSQSLGNLTQSVDLCDPSGRVVGRFVPNARDMSEWEPLDPNEPEVTEEQLNRLSASNEPRYTTAELLAYLEKL